MNEGCGKNLYRKGNSMKRSGPFSELQDSENGKVAVIIPFRRIISEHELMRALECTLVGQKLPSPSLRGSEFLSEVGLGIGPVG